MFCRRATPLPLLPFCAMLVLLTPVLGISIASKASAQMLESQRIRSGQSLGEPTPVHNASQMSVGSTSNRNLDPTTRSANSNVLPASYEAQPTSLSGIPFRAQSDVQTASATTPASPLSTIELKGPSSGNEGRITKPTNQWTTLLSVGFSLGIVVCLFLGVAWIAKKSMPAGSSKLPNEVVEILGRSTIAPRQQVYVLRFGRKLLLVSQQPGQTQTLSEITDEEEVVRLAGICEANSPRSSTRTFSDVLRQVATGKPETTGRPQRKPA